MNKHLLLASNFTTNNEKQAMDNIRELTSGEKPMSSVIESPP